jgi:uncharacterized membrane protein
MKASRIGKLLLDIRNGFWLRPLVMLAAGALAGLLATRVDYRMLAAGWTSEGDVSPGGARALLSVAAGALATTLAISLSMTMVTVQLASSQYTPRLLRRFLADRFTQFVLGAFLATISFLFLVLRAVRSPDEGTFFVPVLSLGLAVLATLACLALLVVFLHRTMRAMQASTIVANIARETVTMIRRIDGIDPLAVPLVGPCQVVRADAVGYIQLLDDAAIREALAESGGAIRREANPGDFVLAGTPLVSVFGGDVLSEQAVTCVRDGFTLGSARTTEADCMFGVRQLVDVALKALSPGLNDVTTAVMVVNELGVIAHAVAHTGLVDDVERLHDDDTSGIYVTRDLSLERYLELAFVEIVAAAQPQPRVLRRILDVLATVCVAEPSAQPILQAFMQRITRSA